MVTKAKLFSVTFEISSNHSFTAIKIKKKLEVQPISAMLQGLNVKYKSGIKLFSG